MKLELIRMVDSKDGNVFAEYYDCNQNPDTDGMVCVYQYFGPAVCLPPIIRYPEPGAGSE